MGVSREKGCLDKLVSFCKPPGSPLQALGGGKGVRDVVLRGLRWLSFDSEAGMQGEGAGVLGVHVRGLGFALRAGDFIMRLAVNPVVSFLWFIQLIF